MSSLYFPVPLHLTLMLIVLKTVCSQEKSVNKKFFFKMRAFEMFMLNIDLLPVLLFSFNGTFHFFIRNPIPWMQTSKVPTAKKTGVSESALS